MNSLDEARQPLNLGVHEEDIPGIFAEVLRYLTPERLSRKLEAVAAGLEQSGPFYREFYLRPLNALWLGMRQVEGSAGGDFRPDRIEADVLPSIHTAALIARSFRPFDVGRRMERPAIYQSQMGYWQKFLS